MINPYSEIDKLYVQIKINADVSTSSVWIPTHEQCTLTLHPLHCTHACSFPRFVVVSGSVQQANLRNQTVKIVSFIWT